MWEALENVAWVKTLSATGWMYATVSVIHYFSIFVFIGLTGILDLRILGVAARRQTATQLAEQCAPWAWTFLALALVSGFLEFSVIAGDYVQTWPFRVKMLVILLAIILSVIVRRSVPRWDRLPVMPAAAKLLAFASLLLWVGAILAGTEIASLTGLG